MALEIPCCFNCKAR